MTRANNNDGLMRYTDADKAEILFIELGYTPKWVKIYNITNADNPQLEWDALLNAGSAGGLITDKATSVTRTEVAVTSGVGEFTPGSTTVGTYGGALLVYDTAATPTYKDENAVTFGYNSGETVNARILRPNGDSAPVDVLAVDMPAVTTDDGTKYRRKAGFFISASANLRVTDADVLTIQWGK